MPDLSLLFNPAPGPLTDLLLKWDRLAIQRGVAGKRRVIWEILDLQSGFKRDRGAIVVELQRWKPTPEVLSVIQWVKERK